MNDILSQFTKSASKLLGNVQQSAINNIGTPVNRAILNSGNQLQQFIESPNPTNILPQFNVARTGTIPLPSPVLQAMMPYRSPITAAQNFSTDALNSVLNLGGGIVNAPAQVIGQGFDIGRILANPLLGRPLPAYNRLRPGIGQLAYNLANAAAPQTMQGTGVNASPQEAVGNYAAAALPFVAAGVGSKGLSAGGKALAGLPERGFLGTVGKGALDTALQTAPYSALSSLDTARNSKNYFPDVARNFATQEASAALLGGALGAGGYALRKGNKISLENSQNASAGQLGSDQTAYMSVFQKAQKQGLNSLTADEKKLLFSHGTDVVSDIGKNAPPGFSAWHDNLTAHTSTQHSPETLAQEMKIYVESGAMNNPRWNYSLRPALSAAPFQNIIYRGENKFNKANGAFWTDDKQLAQEFAGDNGTIRQAVLPPQSVYDASAYGKKIPPAMGNADALNKAIADAKTLGFNALKVDEGMGQTSYYVINPSKLAPSNQAGFINFGALFGNEKNPLTPSQNDLAEALKAKQITPEEAVGLGFKDPNDPVNKIVNALQEAQPIRNKQEALYSAERGKRVAKLVAVGQNVPGEAGYHAQLGQLKGELPKANFEPIRGKLNQQDIDSLFNQIEESQLTPFEKITAKGGLAKLLGAEGGTVPQNSEIELLNKVFPQEFTQAVLDNRSTMQKLWTGGEQALNLPRSIMATADLSAPLRQGIFLVGRPKQFLPASASMIKAFASEDGYNAIQQDIQSRPTYSLMQDSGLALTDMKNPLLTSHEEAFMSNWAEKIPGFGFLAKASNRAYTGFLNKLRADTFDSLVNNAQDTGALTLKPDGTFDNPEVLNNIAQFVNNATGRGNLPGKLSQAAPILNAAFFSPRLMASRLTLLNPGYYATLDPFTRKEALKSLLGFAATGLTTLGLAKLAGAQVSADPRNSDFGKIKVGNTRYDIWGGFQQYIVLAARLLTGQMVSSTTGREINLGEGYKPTTRLDILQHSLEGKEAPLLSFATALLRGQNGIGETTNVPAEVIDRFIPMVMQDAYDLYKEQGPKGLLWNVPGIFGVGVQTYQDQIPMKGTTPTGKPNIQWRAAPSVGEDIWNKMTGTSLSNIPQDQWGQYVQARNDKFKQQTEVAAAKARVLKTGNPETVGSNYIYLNNGIVKTKPIKVTPKSPTSMANTEGQAFAAGPSAPVTQNVPDLITHMFAQGNSPQYYNYTNSFTGKPQQVMINRPLYTAQLSGNPALDKKELQKQKASYTQKANDIVSLYEQGQIPAAIAQNLLSYLSNQSATQPTSTRGGGTPTLRRKTTKLSSSRLGTRRPRMLRRAPRAHLPKPKSVKLKALKVAKPTAKRVKLKV